MNRTRRDERIDEAVEFMEGSWKLRAAAEALLQAWNDDEVQAFVAAAHKLREALEAWHEKP